MHIKLKQPQFRLVEHVPIDLGICWNYEKLKILRERLYTKINDTIKITAIVKREKGT